MARTVTRADGRAEQSKQRAPDKNAVSNGRSIVEGPNRTNCRPNDKANPRSDKHMTWVAVGHPWCWVAAPVVSAPGWYRHSPAAPRQLSFGLAVLCGITSLL